jgi:hypothetical protein
MQLNINISRLYMIVKAIIMFIITEHWLWKRSSNDQARLVSMVILIELLEARSRRLEFIFI